MDIMKLLKEDSGLDIEKINKQPFNESISHNDYLHGLCYQWVLDNYRFGDKIFVITDYDYDIEDYALVHCGIYRDNQYIDVRGCMDDIDEVLEEFDYGEEMDVQIMTFSEFISFCKLNGLNECVDKCLRKYLNEEILTESSLHEIIAESVRKVLSENDGNTVRLYHSTTVDGLNGMLLDGYMDRRACHKGECKWDVIWFSDKRGDYGNGIEISIDVPQELFRNGVFRWMNRHHAITETNVGTDQYGFRIEKVMGVNIDALFSACSGDFDTFMDRLTPMMNEYGIWTGEPFVSVLLRQFGLPMESFFTYE